MNSTASLTWEKLRANTNNLWYECNESDTVIVFVHGVFSDCRNCWLHIPKKTGAQCFWPDLIRQDDRFNCPSIFLGGFYTEIDSQGYGFDKCSDELFQGLQLVDENGLDGPLKKQRIIFICHSTGGVIVRDMLTRRPHEFKDKQIGLLLIASPTSGSKIADRLSWLSTHFNNSLGKHLTWRDELLVDIDKRFSLLIRDKVIPRLVGLEACESKFIIHTRLFFTRTRIVTEESAGAYFRPVVMLPDTDHFATVKPNNKRHPAHLFLLQFWQQSVLTPEPLLILAANPSHSQTIDNTKPQETDCTTLSSVGFPSSPVPDPSVFKTAGPLGGNHPTYIKRTCDLELYQTLETKPFILLRGHNQVGKTSLLYNVQSNPEILQAWTPILLRLEGLRTDAPDTFARSLFKKLNEVCGAQFHDWQDVVDNFRNGRVVFLLDELGKSTSIAAHELIPKLFWTSEQLEDRCRVIATLPSTATNFWNEAGLVNQKYDSWWSTIHVGAFTEDQAVLLLRHLPNPLFQLAVAHKTTIFELSRLHPPRLQAVCRALSKAALRGHSESDLIHLIATRSSYDE